MEILGDKSNKFRNLGMEMKKDKRTSKKAREYNRDQRQPVSEEFETFRLFASLHLSPSPPPSFWETERRKTIGERERENV